MTAQPKPKELDTLLKGSLPEYVLKWIGQQVAQQCEIIVARYAEKTHALELKIVALENELRARVDVRLSEIKDGKDGQDGEKGEKGETGATGERGPEGPRGEPGEKGATGDKGERGEKGADGVIVEKKSAHRGVWRDTEKYGLGDHVSHAGSQWTAIDGDPTGKPGDIGSGWTLTVKLGRDGKDGKDGAPGPEWPREKAREVFREVVIEQLEKDRQQ